MRCSKPREPEHDRLPADTAEAILRVVAWTGGREEFDFMHDRVTRPIDPLDQWRHLSAMTAVRQPELDKRASGDDAAGDPGPGRSLRAQDAPCRKGRRQLDVAFRHEPLGRAAGPAGNSRPPVHARPGSSGSPTSTKKASPSSPARSRSFLAEHALGGHKRSVDQHLERLAVNVGFVPRAQADARRAVGESLSARDGRAGRAGPRVAPRSA